MSPLQTENMIMMETRKPSKAEAPLEKDYSSIMRRSGHTNSCSDDEEEQASERKRLDQQLRQSRDDSLYCDAPMLLEGSPMTPLGGSKRKAMDGGSPSRVGLVKGSTSAASDDVVSPYDKLQRIPSMPNSVEDEKAKLGYEDTTTADRKATRGELKASHNDSGWMPVTPKKRQRYHRRNSFLVRRDSSRALISSSSISVLDAIGQAAPDWSKESEMQLDESQKAPRTNRRRRSSSLDETISPERRYTDEGISTERGHASWSTSDEWVYGFSSLSFDSQATVPLPRKIPSLESDEEPDQGLSSRTKETTMLPPPPISPNRRSPKQGQDEGK